jgi:hypothetical protein
VAVHKLGLIVGEELSIQGSGLVIATELPVRTLGLKKRRRARMFKIRASMILGAALAALLVLQTVAQARFPVPTGDPPPVVETPPPETPPGGTQGCPGGDCGGTPPGGETQHAPEPATMISGLIGIGMALAYSRRRKNKAEV